MNIKKIQILKLKKEFLVTNRNDNIYLIICSKQELTPEEIKQKAKELQEYANKRYKEKQKELAEEQERNRIRASKNINI